MTDSFGIKYNTVILLSIIINILSQDLKPTITDWVTVRSDLETKQTLFNANNLDEYVFSAQTICNCMPCGTTKKYITVKNDKQIDITFSDTSLNCDSTSLYSPDYRTINDWFNVAIDYVDQFSECDGTNTKTSAGHSCNDVSLEVLYDDTYNYPTQIIFDRAAMAYDGGSRWNFDCFDPYYNGIKAVNSTISYNKTCDFVATFPTNSPNTTLDAVTTTTYNVWDEIKAKLIEQQATFSLINYNQYIYSAQISCFCMECGRTTKYISVTDDEIDDISFAANNYNCDEDDLYDSDRRTINDWFNVGIAYCETYRHCNETITTTAMSSDCRDKSLDVLYDDTYGYPTQMMFDQAAMAYDGGEAWYFECFTPYNDNIAVETSSTYTATCDVQPPFQDTPSSTFLPPRSDGHRIDNVILGFATMFIMFLV